MKPLRRAAAQAALDHARSARTTLRHAPARACQPLVREQPPAERPKPTRGEWLDALERRLAAAASYEAVRAIALAPGTQKALAVFDGDDKARLDVVIKAAIDRTTAPSDDDDFPGDRT